MEPSTAGHPANHTKAFDVTKITYYEAPPSDHASGSVNEAQRCLEGQSEYNFYASQTSGEPVLK